jgi:hypothetical protein
MTDPKNNGNTSQTPITAASVAAAASTSSPAPAAAQATAPQIHQGHLTPAEDPTPGQVAVSCPTADEVTITYDSAVDRTGISDNAELVLRQVCSKACIRAVTISSGSRTVASQARAMYGNAQQLGVASQRRLYGHVVDPVLDAYERGLAQHQSADQIQVAMTDEINAIGPEKISRHLSRGPEISTFDVSPKSIPDLEARKRLISEARSDGRVTRFFQPPDDPGYHFEINN